RRLHFGMPAPAGSAARRSDEIAGENFARKIARRPKTGADEEINRGAGMSPSRTGNCQNMYAEPRHGGARDLPKGGGSHKLLTVTLTSSVRLAPFASTSRPLSP